ncbi:hypothetical protein AB3S75_010678 [Citrus x aurantiifolia]
MKVQRKFSLEEGKTKDTNQQYKQPHNIQYHSVSCGKLENKGVTDQNLSEIRSKSQREVGQRGSINQWTIGEAEG